MIDMMSAMIGGKRGYFELIYERGERGRWEGRRAKRRDSVSVGLFGV